MKLIRWEPWVLEGLRGEEGRLRQEPRHGWHGAQGDQEEL